MFTTAVRICQTMWQYREMKMTRGMMKMMNATPLKYILRQKEGQPSKSLTHSGCIALLISENLILMLKVGMQGREGTKETSQATDTRMQGDQGTARGLVMAR